MSFLGRHKKSSTPVPFRNLSEEMNRMMQDFWGTQDFPALQAWADKSMTQWTPKLNVSETDTEYRITAELPGLSKDDVDVSFHDNTLFLKGERRWENTEEKEDYHHVETSYGQFMRTIPFAKSIDEEKVAAEFKDGMLKVTLAKSAEPGRSARKISIK